MMTHATLLEVNQQMASFRETLALLDVSHPTLIRWLNDGRFPNARKGEGKTGEWSIPQGDIEAVRQELIDELLSQIEKLRSLAKRPYQ